MKKLLLLSLCLTLHAHTHCMEEAHHLPQAEAGALAEELVENVFNNLLEVINDDEAAPAGGPILNALIGGFLNLGPQPLEPAHHAPEEDAVND